MRGEMPKAATFMGTATRVTCRMREPRADQARLVITDGAPRLVGPAPLPLPGLRPAVCLRTGRWKSSNQMVLPGPVKGKGKRKGLRRVGRCRYVEDPYRSPLGLGLHFRPRGRQPSSCAPATAVVC